MYCRYTTKLGLTIKKRNGRHRAYTYTQETQDTPRPLKAAQNDHMLNTYIKLGLLGP